MAEECKKSFGIIKESEILCVSPFAGMKLDRRIEEAVPAGQQLQELGMRLRCDDASSDQVSYTFGRSIFSCRYSQFLFSSNQNRMIY